MFPQKVVIRAPLYNDVVANVFTSEAHWPKLRLQVIVNPNAAANVILPVMVLGAGINECPNHVSVSIPPLPFNQTVPVVPAFLALVGDLPHYGSNFRLRGTSIHDDFKGVPLRSTMTDIICREYRVAISCDDGR